MTDRQSMIQNTMSTNNHKFVLNKNGLKIFNWQVQSVDLPEIALARARAISSPKVASWELAGTGISFGELDVTFLLDENMEAWIENYRWMKELVDPYHNQKDKILNTESTASLHLLNNNRSALGKIFNFKRVWPVHIGPVSFTSTNNEPEELTCTISFKYDTFELEVDAGVVI